MTKQQDKYRIARDLGVSHQAVYLWFGGKTKPSAKNLMKLRKLDYVDEDDIWEMMEL